jgi:hypothetical protein
MKLLVFTNIYLVLMCLGFMMGFESSLWSVVCSLAFGSTVAFSVVPVFDETAFQRIRMKNGFSMPVFYFGHILLHILPCIFFIYNPPLSVSIFHTWLAHIIQLSWAFIIHGSIFLDNVYVPLQRHVWYKMWAITLVCHYLPLFTHRWGGRWR